MIGLVVITHARLGRELVNAAEFILGKIEQIETVAVESNLEADHLRKALTAALGKADRGEGAARLAERYEGSLAVSAHTGHHIDLLRATIGDRVRAMTELAELVVPWDRGDVLAAVHREGQVLSEAAEEHGMRLKARLEPASLGALREFVVEGLPSS